MGSRRAVVDLFLASALSLFVELVFIRWVASEIRIFGFYRNLALIGAFLGMGLGFATYRDKQGAPWFEKYYLPCMAVAALFVLAVGRSDASNILTTVSHNPQEYVWGQVTANVPIISPLINVLFYVVILVTFAGITAVFVPIGELVASKFSAFKPLPGYTINVLGSLVGIVIYTGISFLSAPPPIWFLIAGLGAFYFIPLTSWRRPALAALMVAVPLGLTWLWPTGSMITVWSPYYRIDVHKQYPQYPDLLFGYDLSTNQSFHQFLLNLSPDFVKANYNLDPQHFDYYLAEYDAPFKPIPRLDNVLVVGAGTGNDVAAALRAGAVKVTAVEIDPVIFQLGEQLHPEHPYADPARVTQVLADARSFFRHDRQTYDAIIFGLLDSQTLFGTASSVRLDNFVYTRESLTEARNLLAPDGMMMLTFAVPKDKQWIGLRIYRNLNDVFGHPPQVYIVGPEDTMFVIARNPLPDDILAGTSATLAPGYSYRPDVAPATDDWPYLYLEKPVIPDAYLIILAGVIILSLLVVRRALPDFRQFNIHLFFMGAAFFMLETKSTTEIALLFGSTWIVNSVVIGAILLMIVLANVAVIRFKITDVRPWYGLLGPSLLFNFLVPVSSFLSLDLGLRIGLASVALAVPLFFAGMIFAITFSQVKSIESALGSNLVGSVLGGILEYTSLIYGVRSLYLFALALYALSALALLIAARRGGAQTA